MNEASDAPPPPKWLGKRTRRKPDAGPPQELISATVRRWTVTSAVVEKGEHWKSTKVRVSKLHYSTDGVSPGKAVVTLEGPNSDRTLQAFADRQNATGATLKEHHKAFADFSEAARQKSMVRHNKGFTGPGFDEPEPKQKEQPSPKTPRKADRAAKQS